MCYRLFDSRDAVRRSVIEGSRGETPNERAQCYLMLRYVMDDIPTDFTARWSAGSSILAFISTIVGLLSNSINETTAIVDECVVLAFALAVSFTMVFNKRFGDRPNLLTDTIFEGQSDSHARIQTALAILGGLIAQSRMSRPWWKSSRRRLIYPALSQSLLAQGSGTKCTESPDMAL